MCMWHWPSRPQAAWWPVQAACPGLWWQGTRRHVDHAWSGEALQGQWSKEPSETCILVDLWLPLLIFKFIFKLIVDNLWSSLFIFKFIFDNLWYSLIIFVHLRSSLITFDNLWSSVHLWSFWLTSNIFELGRTAIFKWHHSDSWKETIPSHGW